LGTLNVKTMPIRPSLHDTGTTEMGHPRENLAEYPDNDKI